MSRPLFPIGRPFPPGLPMTLQPRGAQASAFQQATELVADAVGEPSLRVDPADPDPAGTFRARARELSPARRKQLKAQVATVCVALFETAKDVLESGMSVNTAIHLAYFAIALYTVTLLLEE